MANDNFDTKHLWGTYKLKSQLATAQSGLAKCLSEIDQPKAIRLWEESIKFFKEAIQARDQAYGKYNPPPTNSPPPPPPTHLQKVVP